MRPPIDPVNAVELVWGISGKFSNDDKNQELAKQSETEYKNQLDSFRRMIAAASIPAEKEKYGIYYGVLISSMNITIRSLGSHLRHRNYHFEEVEMLRKQQRESIERMKKFGLNFENAFPKLASSAAIGGISGLSIVNILNDLGLTELQKNIFFLSFLGFGYLFTEFVVLPLVIYANKRAMNANNIARRQHYELYASRCRKELNDLLTTLKGAYEQAFDREYVEPDGWALDAVVPGNGPYEIMYTWRGTKKTLIKDSQDASFVSSITVPTRSS